MSCPLIFKYSILSDLIFSRAIFIASDGSTATNFSGSYFNKLFDIRPLPIPTSMIVLSLIKFKSKGKTISFNSSILPQYPPISLSVKN